LKRALLAAILLILTAAGPALAAEHPIGDGAWSWFGDPRAVTHDGRTYVGWVDREGDIKVSSYEHATGERITAVLQARLNQDDHANPSIHVRPDGRLVIFYSRHVGPAMHYRVSSQPGDVTSWEAPQTIPTNSPGIRGYTYPNPIRIEGEDRTYLFWRGGNYNPTFSTQEDGQTTWSPARTLITMPGQRPYVKYDSSAGDTIHVAYTNAHPGEFGDVNIYYARVNGGQIQRADGTQVGSLDDPISPGEGDLVYNPTEPTWIHDVAADSAGNPVIVFARLFSSSDHRYYYARRESGAWQVRLMTPAGGTFREDGGSPYYSGGLTLDHEDPSRVYLSRQTGAGTWQVEAWTTPNGGASWTSQTVSSTGKNVRPVSPRGMTATGGSMSVLWMRGGYPDYLTYTTEIDALMTTSDVAPIADAEPSVHSGRAPLEVRFDATMSGDADGSIASYAWDFGDDANGSGAEPAHTYTASGRYFPTLTVTDDDGNSATLVEEILIDLPAPPVAYTGGANGSTVHGAVSPQNQATEWSVEYGPTNEYGAVTSAGSLSADSDLHQVSATLPDLQAGGLYHYRLVANNATGSTTGEDRVLVAGATPGSDAYRDTVLTTPGVTDYWRLGELSGSTSRDETSSTTGAFQGRYVLGQPGVLGPLRNATASFDGTSGELAISGSDLSGPDATLEGWFRWRSGTAVLRDSTSTGGTGWILAFEQTGDLRYRLGGQGFDTNVPIDQVRDGEWHHIAVTKQGTAAALYLDGGLEHSSPTGAGPQPAVSPWHVMRNGANAVFSEGEADEVALYARALSASEVRAHYDLAQDLADDPPPDPPAGPGPGNGAEPPLAGTGPGGGVLNPGTGPFPTPETTAPPRGSVSVRGGRLVVRGAPGVRNVLIARRSGRSWVVRDRRAALRPGRHCRRLSARAVSCRAAGVRRLVAYGGAGDDRLTVIGRVRVTFRGGPGRDTRRLLR
jgi:hypothetical protein